jgi:hypothetical protein
MATKQLNNQNFYQDADKPGVFIEKPKAQQVRSDTTPAEQRRRSAVFERFEQRMAVTKERMFRKP